MLKATYYFPQDFVWGTATSSYQVEGQNTHSDWWAAEQSGEMPYQSGDACRWMDLDRALADLDFAAEMGNNAHRMSIEWSRIEPEPGKFSTEAFEYYRALLEGMRARGLTPMVTLHHFSNPQWFVEEGDFLSEDVADYFHRYATRAADALGDLVGQWVTLNEPLVYFHMRHISQDFPKPKGDLGWGPGRAMVRGMLEAHAAAFHAIKWVTPETPVGMAKNWMLFDGYRKGNLFDWGWARVLSFGFNREWMRSLMSGRAGTAFGGGKIKHLADSYDFIGLNYYSNRAAKFLSAKDPEKPSPTSMGEIGHGRIYPEGLLRAIMANVYYRKPIYITENGVPDADDALRPGFLLRHLHQVWHGINHVAPVMGYYHYSLIDNYEWDRGWRQRFGLVAVDPETQTRTLRNSGRLYGEICRKLYIDNDLVERYAPEIQKNLFPE